MKDFLIQIVQALVDNPEEVQVNAIEGTQTVVLELKVAKSDLCQRSFKIEPFWVVRIEPH
jgi:predicted RNA-binding protein YlqC (UPF0109 family)